VRIDFLGLQAFLSIAERGSFQRAASHLNLSQTALSHRIRKLEEDLGLKLLTRTTRQVTLTPAGSDLLPKAKRIIDEIGTAFQSLREQGRERQARLAFGCLPTIAIHHLPRLLQLFSAAHPDVAVTVFDNSVAEIGELVQSGSAEFGITIISSSRWDLESKPLFKEPFVLVCPVGHPLSSQKSLNWGQLEGVPLVRVSPQSGNRLLIDDALGSRREQFIWRYEVQHVATAVSMVLAGVGLTIVPQLAVDVMGTPGIVAVQLRNPGVARTIGLIWRRGAALSPAGEAMIGLIAKHVRGKDETG
jgi:DNA-binding transcriptional LysR family regulator